MAIAANRSVAITGIGIVSALGNSVAEFWEACLLGRTCVEPIPAHWMKYYKPKSKYWSPLALPDYSAYGLRRSDLLTLDVTALNAIVAADDALNFAGIRKDLVDERAGRYGVSIDDSFRAGIYIGTGLGCISSTLQNYVPHLLGQLRDDFGNLTGPLANAELYQELVENIAVQPRVSPVASCKSMANSISAVLSMRYGMRGSNDTLIAACAAGSTAIARAYRAIRYGEIDLALAGGSEYYGDRAGGVFMAFDRLNTLVKPDLSRDTANRPFDKARSGFLFSEGAACVLVLESQEHAYGRGVRPIANIIGSGGSSDARSLVAIARDDNAIMEMIARALADAEISAADIDYVNAHGTSTEQNDEIEADIIGAAFRDGVAVNSTKSLLGHTIGACGAIEAAVTALSVRHQEIHPSLNIDQPVLDLNFPKTRMPATIDFAFTQNFGFGGHNVGLVISV